MEVSENGGTPQIIQSSLDPDLVLKPWFLGDPPQLRNPHINIEFILMVLFRLLGLM